MLWKHEVWWLTQSHFFYRSYSIMRSLVSKCSYSFRRSGVRNFSTSIMRSQVSNCIMRNGVSNCSISIRRSQVSNSEKAGWRIVVFSIRESRIAFTSLSICVYWSYFRWKDWKLIYGNDASRVEQEHRGAWRKPEENMQLPTLTGDDCRRMINGKTVARCLFNLKGMSHEAYYTMHPT